MSEECTSCSKCQRLYKEAMELNCFHSFCKACLRTDGSETHVDDYTLCSKCNLKTPNSCLESDHFLNSFCDIIKFERSLDEVCSICRQNEKEISSAFYCFECKESLCTACRRQHLVLQRSHNHEVVLFSRVIEKGFSRQKKSHLSCEFHNESISHCCMTCSSLHCMACIIEGHKQHWSLPSDKALKYQSTNIREIIKRMETFHSAAHEQEQALLKYLDFEKEKLISETKDHFTKMIQDIKREETRILHEVEAAFEKYRQLAKKSEHECRMLCLSAKAVSSKFKLINKYGNPADMLRFYYKVRNSEVAIKANDNISVLPKFSLKNISASSTGVRSLLKDIYISVHKLQGDFITSILKSVSSSEKLVNQECTVP